MSKFDERIGAAMVVGGGVSGMTAALDLARKGFDVILVEKQELLGGRLNDLHHIFPKMESAKEIVEKLVAEVQKEKLIKVMLNSKVVSRDGSYGNYDIEILSFYPCHRQSSKRYTAKNCK